MRKWIKIVAGSLLGIVVLAVAVLAVMNLRPDANRMHTSITMRQRPESVWPWLYEPPKLKQWVTWLVDVKPGDGPPVLGKESVWVMEDRNNNNALMQIASRVSAVEPGHSLAVDLSSPAGFHGSASYTLTDLGGGQTRLESEGRYVFENRFARFMTPVVLVFAKKKAASDLAHLRQLVEAGR